MYSTPPQVAFVASAALIVGTVNTILVPAQGVGTRIRVSGGSFAMANACTGIVEVEISDNVAVPVWYTALSQSQRWAPIQLPEPGIPISANSPLRGLAISTIATGFITYRIFFYVDAIS